MASRGPGGHQQAQLGPGGVLVYTMVVGTFLAGPAADIQIVRMGSQTGCYFGLIAQRNVFDLMVTNYLWPTRPGTGKNTFGPGRQLPGRYRVPRRACLVVRGDNLGAVLP
jgi:hypothetical protein